MTKALIACATLQKEIEMVMRKHNITFDYIGYVDSGLHNTTKRLREAVLKKREEMEDTLARAGKSPERLLFCFGLCGNMVDGLENGPYDTFVPKTEDCITWMLGSKKRRRRLDRKKRGYFLTAGWLKGEANLHEEYKKTIAMYGNEMADEIFAEILHGYETIYLLDTEVDGFDTFAREGKNIADDFGLECDTVKGELSWFERYLLEDFASLAKEGLVLHYKPQETIHFQDYL